MKVKVIHRNPGDFVQSNPGEIKRRFRNPDPRLHPFERAREYSRALLAVKLDKLFAKPFISSLDGHTDSVQCLSRSHKHLADLFTGSCDGEVRMWNLDSKQCHKSIRAHEGFVRGVCVSHDDKWLFSCGDDKKIKQWNIEKNKNALELNLDEVTDTGHLMQNGDIKTIFKDVTPTTVFQAQSALTSVDHHWHRSSFVSSGDTVDVWDYHRSAPVQTFEWGCEKVMMSRFNPSEPYLVASTAADNSIALHDLRGKTSLRKIILRMRSNALCWNPFQPIHFTVANEDHNLYTFDMRRMDAALLVHKDFTNSVMDIDYSPTGLEFVAGSFDRTLRIFETNSGRSRDVYHTKRMQNVLCCRYTADTRYIVSGSTDFCIRIWKADAAAPLGPRSYRERQAIAYRASLKEKFAHMKEIKRIARHRHVPILIKKTAEKKREMENAQRRKENNVRTHSKKDAHNFVAQRKKAIVDQVE
ncbi:Sof1 family domain-containing protein [Cardiosporidium cionae]|uniref:DDB1- and CUL4-associated factor 13 n=1 Tax=Cardiosporidium cionae TaxID=476202 RepID=A0ABQ7J8M7_9APIC|nr:Sof1 family domain-containing protein [Cardiosporidium cionae]|eukprot:KAF8820357.1 Sof1 family domain-containing protein [Cardiosporidium cionae]